MVKQKKLAVVVSHPIQYYTPYYRALSSEGSVHLQVYFCSRIGLNNLHDPGMGVRLSWNTDLTSGYDHVFLPEADGIKVTGFSAINNPSISSNLEAFKPDVVLLHGYAQATMLRALCWCKSNHIPAMMISDRSFKGKSPPHRHMARRIVLPLILKQFRAFLALGDAIHEFYKSFGVRDEQIFRVPNMLDEGFWMVRKQQLQERGKIRTQLGLSDEFVVLFVGKLIQRKRPQDLLSVLQLLRERSATPRKITVLFAGDGKMRDELEKQAKKENLPVHFLGFVNIDELPKYYCAADALAHPAEHESFGLIALEAAVMGLPLVLSEGVGAVGPTGIARPDRNTIVHKIGDIGAIENALVHLASQPETCARMSEASTLFADDHGGRVSVQNTLAAIDFCLSRMK